MANDLNRQLVSLCTGSGITLSTAESCTGGLLGSTITDVPGASACFLGGIVAYSNESKIDMLDVDPSTLEHHGAVSEAVAVEMAQGCMKRFGSMIAVSISGIAGPGGWTRAKPVGTVYIAVAGGDLGTACEVFALGSMGRKRFKDEAVKRALTMLMERASAAIQGGERNGSGMSA